MKYTRYNREGVAEVGAKSYDLGLRAYMVAVYRQMAIALAITGMVSFGVASSEQLVHLLFGTPLQWIVMFAPIGMVFYISARLMRMTAPAARMSLWIYSGLMGLSLAAIFLMYTGESIARTFFITASLFGVMSIYGHTTKKDLTGFSAFFTMGLIGLILASLVNVFLQSSMLAFVVSALGVIVFTFLTAYETQRLKTVYYQLSSVSGTSDMIEKVSVYGALSLYMSFINLFMSLLHFFGDRK
jgi:uncharacterized protein